MSLVQSLYNIRVENGARNSGKPSQKQHNSHSFSSTPSSASSSSSLLSSSSLSEEEEQKQERELELLAHHDRARREEKVTERKRIISERRRRRDQRASSRHEQKINNRENQYINNSKNYNKYLVSGNDNANNIEGNHSRSSSSDESSTSSLDALVEHALSIPQKKKWVIGNSNNVSSTGYSLQRAQKEHGASSSFFASPNVDSSKSNNNNNHDKENTLNEFAIENGNNRKEVSHKNHYNEIKNSNNKNNKNSNRNIASIKGKGFMEREEIYDNVDSDALDVVNVANAGKQRSNYTKIESRQEEKNNNESKHADRSSASRYKFHGNFKVLPSNGNNKCNGTSEEGHDESDSSVDDARFTRMLEELRLDAERKNRISSNSNSSNSNTSNEYRQNKNHNRNNNNNNNNNSSSSRNNREGSSSRNNQTHKGHSVARFNEATAARLTALNASARAKKQEKYEVQKAKAEANRKDQEHKSIKTDEALKRSIEAGERLYRLATSQQALLSRMRKSADEERDKAIHKELTFKPTISTLAQKLNAKDYAPLPTRSATLIQTQMQRRRHNELTQEYQTLRQCTFHPLLAPRSEAIIKMRRRDEMRRRNARHAHRTHISLNHSHHHGRPWHAKHLHQNSLCNSTLDHERSRVSNSNNSNNNNNNDNINSTFHHHHHRRNCKKGNSNVRRTFPLSNKMKANATSHSSFKETSLYHHHYPLNEDQKISNTKVYDLTEKPVCHEPFDDPAERLYHDGEERLLRMQIRQRMAADQVASEMVGNHVKLTREEMQCVLARMEDWLHKRNQRVSLMREELIRSSRGQQEQQQEEYLQEEEEEEEQEQEQFGSKSKSTRVERSISRARSVPPLLSKAKKIVEQQAVSNAIKLQKNELKRSNTSHAYLRKSQELPRSSTFTITKSKEAEKEEEEEEKKLKIDSSTEWTRAQWELRMIRYGALFYKYLPSISANTMTISQIKSQVQRMYPEDAALLLVLERCLGSSERAIDKITFINTLAEYERAHGPQPWGWTQKDSLLFNLNDVDKNIGNNNNSNNTKKTNIISRENDNNNGKRKKSNSEVNNKEVELEPSSREEEEEEELLLTSSNLKSQRRQCQKCVGKNSNIYRKECTVSNHARKQSNCAPHTYSQKANRIKLAQLPDNNCTFKPQLNKRSIYLSNEDKRKRAIKMNVHVPLTIDNLHKSNKLVHSHNVPEQSIEVVPNTSQNITSLDEIASDVNRGNSSSHHAGLSPSVELSSLSSTERELLNGSSSNIITTNDNDINNLHSMEEESTPAAKLATSLGLYTPKTLKTTHDAVIELERLLWATQRRVNALISSKCKDEESKMNQCQQHISSPLSINNDNNKKNNNYDHHYTKEKMQSSAIENNNTNGMSSKSNDKNSRRDKFANSYNNNNNNNLNKIKEEEEQTLSPSPNKPYMNTELMSEKSEQLIQTHADNTIADAFDSLFDNLYRSCSKSAKRP